MSVPTPSEPRGGLDRLDLSAFALTLVATLAIYTWNLAPTVTLEDSGELIVAAHHLGVPHPPGYPIWTVLTWLVQRPFAWMTFRGHPNPAWGVAFASALFGALACANVALLVARSGRDLVARIPRLLERPGPEALGQAAWMAGIASGLLLAFTQCLWSQSMIAEVYSLNAAFLTGVVLAAYAWMRRPGDDRWLLLTCFLFGLGVTNHQTLLFVALALAAVVFFARPALFRDLAVLCAGVGGVALIWVKVAAAFELGRLNPLLGPGLPGFWVFLAFHAAALAAAWRWLPEGRLAATALLTFEMGLAFYLYMPLASEQNPPMNWGYARTWEGLMHAITRGQYERIEATQLFSRRFVDQIGLYLSDLRRQYTLPILLLGFLPFTLFRIRVTERWHSGLLPALSLIVAASVLTLAEEWLTWGQVDGTVPALAAGYRLCVLLVMVLAMIGTLILGMEMVLDQMRAFPRRPRSIQVVWALVALGGCLVVAAVALRLFGRLLDPDLEWWDRLLLAVVVFCPPAILFVSLRLNSRGQIEFEAPEATRAWLACTAIAFLAVSLILIYFLNQDLDIQTLFIGRVQFIQSHVIFAIWIGYGLLLALASLLRVREGRIWRVALTVAALGLPVFAYSRDIWDEELLRIYGASRQRHHDFGWQFGVYALEGRDAIVRDLAPGEAPPPDPDYPPPMDQGAIFFGGTDPGRFVPTYLLFSAEVRPDVFLITQNALADRSYLRSMRDLYGDRIWIPSENANSLAFQRYRQEIRDGKFPRSLQLLEESPSGDLRVTGTAGVMVINGYLTETMFRIHRHERSFYVEESYPIAWMLPHLVPHGLVMKIEPEPLEAIPEARVAEDRRFWAWTTERLLRDPRYLRDVAARRSFAKLRAALAGLYSFRERWDDAEAAYRESIALYPLSPEPYFRLAESLVRQERYAEALATLETFFELDPGFTKAEGFTVWVAEHVEADLHRKELGGRDPASLSIEDLHRLLTSLLVLDDKPAWQKLIMGVLDQAPPDPQRLRLASLILAKYEHATWEVLVLRKYLDGAPGDAVAWVDFAAALLHSRRNDESLQALAQAVGLGGRPIQDRIRRDVRFNPLRGHPPFDAIAGLPGRAGTRP